MEFAHLPGAQIEIEGSAYLSLKSMKGVAYHFDENTLTLELTVTPDLLEKTTLNLMPTRRTDVLYPRDRSIFLNYGIDYSAGGDNLAFEGLTLSNELGVRHRDLLLLTDTLYTESPDDSRFVRLNTSLTWDDRKTLRRLTGGDFFASSGELGSRVPMGGVSFSKLYLMDPYFIRYPMFDFSGMASLPSDVELYVDGVRVRSERFAPGEFELRNFQSVGGAQTIEIVIRDALGREQRIVSPFYFTDQILRRGLHEYSYNLGLLRRDFGQESNNYSDLAFSGFHRYGMTDSLNLGLRGEVGDGLANLGIESAIKTGNVGLLRLEGAGSHDRDDSGAAGLLSYEYYNRRFRGRLAFQGFSEGYRALGEAESTTRRKLNILAGIGYVTPELGSFGIDYAKTESYHNPERETLTFSWSRRLWRGTYGNFTFRQIRENETTHEAGVSLTWYLGRDHSVSGAVRRERGADIQVLEARRNTPAGEGTGWNLRGERTEREGTQTYLLNSVAQHNARHAILRGDFSMGRSETLTTEDLRLSLAGSLVQVGDTFALSRPVTDSFALVTVGDAEGVGVYVNGQASGHTNGRGKLVIPELSSYYENQVSIEDKDIPLDYLMPRVRLNVSPPLRSGSCLNFPLQKYQAFTGALSIEDKDGRTPLAYAELNLAAPAGPVTFWTGGEGEFYLDSQQVEFDLAAQQGCEALEKKTGTFLPAGVYPLTVKLEGRIFHSEITIPQVSDQFAELGEIVLPVVSAMDTREPTAATVLLQSSVVTAPAERMDTAGLVHTSLPENTESPSKPVEPVETVEPNANENSASKPIEGPRKEVIHFPFDRATPVAADMPLLVTVTDFLLTHPEVTVDLEGHTCQLGSETYNDRLGQLRVIAIRNHLIDAGIAAQRISRLTSYGEHRPVCLETIENCLRLNRRAVLLLFKPPKN